MKTLMLEIVTFVGQHFWVLWILLSGVIIILAYTGFRLYTYTRHQYQVWQRSLELIPETPVKRSQGVLESKTESAFQTRFLQAYRLTNWSLNPYYYVAVIVTLSLALVTLLSFIFGSLWGAFGGVLSLLAGLGLVWLKASDQRSKAIEQIPAFLEALSQAMQAGYSVTNALSFMADELDSPLKQSIERVNAQLSLQVPLEEAFATLAVELEQPEIDFLVEGTLIQTEIGGNLVQLFQNMALIIEEKLKLSRDIKSFTSQGKLSGLLIAALWPVSLGLFTWLSPQHTEVLFYTLTGQVLLFLSLFLQLIGFVFIWKIIRVQL